MTLVLWRFVFRFFFFNPFIFSPFPVSFYVALSPGRVDFEVSPIHAKLVGSRPTSLVTPAEFSCRLGVALPVSRLIHPEAREALYADTVRLSSPNGF